MTVTPTPCGSLATRPKRHRDAQRHADRRRAGVTVISTSSELLHDDDSIVS
jgi:hypothetical protein